MEQGFSNQLYTLLGELADTNCFDNILTNSYCVILFNYTVFTIKLRSLQINFIIM